jgi:hypothetical protein
MMARQTFTRRRYPTVTDHGATVRDYSDTPEEADFTGSIQPAAATEDTVNRNGAEVAYTIWASPDADVNHYDLVTLYAATYYVNGEPERWASGVLDHAVIYLSRWVG